MLVVLGLGIGLVVFGALVLIRFPDRPGGRIAWRGLELSSTGAGLPLIVLGLIAATMAASGLADIDLPVVGADGGGGDHVEDPARGCLAGLFTDIPEKRVVDVHSGAPDQWVVGLTQPKQPPVALILHEAGRPLGAVRFQLFPESGVFHIDQVVNASCRPLEDVRTSGETPDKVPKYGDLILSFENGTYRLNMGGDDENTHIEVDFQRIVE